MTSPLNAVTTDEGRFYEHPNHPGHRFPSITTIIKEGTPKPAIAKWQTKKAVDLALSQFDKLQALINRSREDK